MDNQFIIMEGNPMQPPTYREIISRLIHEGYVRVGQKGSHARYSDGRHSVTVAGVGGSRPSKGTWGNIKRQAGWREGGEA